MVKDGVETPPRMTAHLTSIYSTPPGRSLHEGEASQSGGFGELSFSSRDKVNQRLESFTVYSLLVKDRYAAITASQRDQEDCVTDITYILVVACLFLEANPQYYLSSSAVRMNVSL